MKARLYTIDKAALRDNNVIQQHQAIHALETGKVLFFPELTLETPLLSTEDLLSESVLDASHKNISYHYPTQRLGKFNQSCLTEKMLSQLQPAMHQYAEFAKDLVTQTLPTYKDALIWGRTSFRPAQVDNRISSKRKDDTRLHVDSFSATPVYGKRILRVFTNINPHQATRVWHLGEPFEKVLARFAPHIPQYHYLAALFLKTIKTTKTLRSPYDHYQIYLHDRMKRDDTYQQTAEKARIEFPANSTWMVFTDQVSHAALSGQFLLEQTFYLPVSAMQQPEQSPLKQWERLKGRLA